MSETLGHAGIVRRLEDYFGRQIAFFERIRVEIEEIASGADLGQLDRLLDDDALRAREGKNLEDEFRALKNEWDNTESIPDADAESVRGLADRAAELAVEIQRSLDLAVQRNSGLAETLRERMGELRHGREWLAKYRQTSPTDGGLIDHRA